MNNKISIKAVNLLFLIVLCLQLVNFFFLWLPQYVRLILNEAIFVFLPAFIFLRLMRQPIKERVRWNWPGWKIAILALVIGLGIYPLSAASASIFMQLLGYSNFITPADAIPGTLLMGVLAIAAYAVMAPLCEEFLFRGVIQPVYEKRGVKWAIGFTGLLFIVFHLSLLQGLSIVLLTLLLGYVYHRTRSLQASILTHFGANFLAALVITEEVIPTGMVNFLFQPAVMAVGAAAAFTALTVLIQQTRSANLAPDLFEDKKATEAPTRANGLTTYWPLLVALIVYLPVIGMEVYYARSLEMTAEPLSVGRVEWKEGQSWQYQIRNIVDEQVGEGTCELVKRGETAEVTCISRVEAYEVQTGSSFYSSSGGERIDGAHFRLEDGQVIGGSFEMDLFNQDVVIAISWAKGENGIEIEVTDKGTSSQIDMPYTETPLADQDNLLIVANNTWPWQTAGIEFEQGTSGRLATFKPYTWRPKTQDSGPVVEGFVVTVGGREKVITPAGEFTTWKVDLGDNQTAWYDVNDPQKIVKYFNGIETWLLDQEGG